jgi:NAD+ synthase (glutamine-hydrolysing)
MAALHILTRMQTLRIALAQINCTLGDVRGNADKIKTNIAQAREAAADIVVFPELAICGYPPEDLMLKPSFLDDCRSALDDCAREAQGLIAVIGFPEVADDTYNSAAVCANGAVASIYRKQYLPNYGVFDENRYFQQGTRASVCHLPLHGDDVIFGVNICEDIWYSDGPLRVQALAGDAELAINLSASPYHRAKGRWREQMFGTRAADHACIVAFCNLVGGQDELIFDGQSMLFNQHGDLIARGKQFEEDFIVADVDVGAVFRQRLHDPRRRKAKQTLLPEECDIDVVQLPAVAVQVAPSRKPPVAAPLEQRLDPLEEIYRALVLGTHDYVRKCGFQRVLLGLSGGVDSALVAAIAADALGAANITCAAMPSQFSSDDSYEDAVNLADKFGIRLIVLPIKEIFEQTTCVLRDEFKGAPFGLAEENLQARIRGNLLMTMSNKLGGMVLTTGNKSETSVGYSTLYGDTAGGLAVIKDVPKTLVYELCEWRNRAAGQIMIPERILTKAPTAELRPNQKDSDSLPPYDILDPILRMYVEEDRAFEEIVGAGYDEATVRRVIRLVDAAEYKRRQSPPGLKITPRAFGRDRRLPIVNSYRIPAATATPESKPAEPSQQGIASVTGTGVTN